MKRCLAWLTLWFVLVVSCKDATQTNVVVRTNVAYAGGMSIGVWASHSGPATGGVPPLVQSEEPWLADGEVGDVYVTPQAGRRDGTLTVRVAMGLRGKPVAECVGGQTPASCILAKRKLAFVPHAKLKLPVVLYAACEGVQCSEDTTCSYLGKCVPAQVDPAACATPEGCLLPGEPPFAPSTQPLNDAGTSDSGAAALPVELAAAVGHSCARLADGSVKCWGQNNVGQLGLGDTQQRGDGPGEMGGTLPGVDLGPGRTVLELAGGANHTCARLDNGSVKCWGRNANGQLGLGDSLDRGNEPGEMGAALAAVDLGPGRTALQLAVGESHSCARLDNGSVKCWGRNLEGQLGLGDPQDRGDASGELGATLPAVDFGQGRTALQVAAGGYHTCARLDDGSVKCWGRNFEGQLGLGDTPHRGDGPGEMGAGLPAVDLGLGRTALQLVAGLNHTCARLDDGSLKCWGLNNGGQLGLGDGQRRGDGPGEMGATLPVVELGPGRSAVQVAAGYEHTCARLDDGSVKCWGNGIRLGLGDTRSRGDGAGEMGANLPVVDLGSGRTALQLAAGANHTCASLDDGSIKCWGLNDFGQLGLGDTQTRGDGAGEMGANLPMVLVK